MDPAQQCGMTFTPLSRSESAESERNPNHGDLGWTKKTCSQSPPPTPPSCDLNHRGFDHMLHHFLMGSADAPAERPLRSADNLLGFSQRAATSFKKQRLSRV